MNVSLVIRCYNEEAHIGRLLEGVMKQTVKDVEIIVVDSGSTDSTVSIATDYPVKLLTIKPEDFSFGRSLNLGCAAATGDIIVIASAHVYPTYNDWIERLLAPFEDPKVALSYGKQRGNETSKFSELQVLAKWFPDQSDFNQSNPFCNNANSAVRRTLWEGNTYDESLTGLEDTAWAQRAMEQGHRIAYVAEAEIAHVHNESMDKILTRYRREAIAFKRIFPQERFGFSDFIRLFSANFINDCLQARKDGVLLRNLTEIIGFRLMQFWGTYRGYKQHGLVSTELWKTFYYPNQSPSSSASTHSTSSRTRISYSDDSTADQTERKLP